MKRLLRSILFAVVPARAAQRLQFALKQPSRRRAPAATGNPSKDAILKQVADQGSAVIEDYLSADECIEAIDDFEWADAAYSKFFHRNEDDRVFGAEHFSRVARKFNRDPLWLELADAYGGEPHGLFCTAANRVLPGAPGGLGSGGDWHRDGFARELKVIVYLNDVTIENGPFQMLRGSHSSEGILSDMRTGQLAAAQNRVGSEAVEHIIAADPDRLVKFTCRAGTAIVFDDSSIHTGAPIVSGQRYALTNYIAAQRLITEALFAEYAPIIREPLPLRQAAAAE